MPDVTGGPTWLAPTLVVLLAAGNLFQAVWTWLKRERDKEAGRYGPSWKSLFDNARKEAKENAAELKLALEGFALAREELAEKKAMIGSLEERIAHLKKELAEQARGG